MKVKPYKRQFRESLYLHINNGGISIDLKYDEIGRKCLNISASHFGTKTNEMLVPIDKPSLKHIILELVEQYQSWDESDTMAVKGKDFGVARGRIKSSAITELTRQINELLEPESEAYLQPKLTSDSNTLDKG